MGMVWYWYDTGMVTGRLQGVYWDETCMVLVHIVLELGRWLGLCWDGIDMVLVWYWHGTDI